MMAFLKTDGFIWVIVITNIILLILYILTTINAMRTKKEYKIFMKKLGNGNNIEEILKEQLKRIENMELKTNDLAMYCKDLNKNMSHCIQKVGIIRYSAFKDVGSDLSFALALLDEDNNGIVLNGIYSSEASNIYAKPILKGESKYKITEEEKQAIDIAKANDGVSHL